MGKAYYSSKSSAIDLLLTLCDKGILSKFFEYILRELQNPLDFLTKEALLLAFGSISEQVKQNSALRDQIEPTLSNHVYSEFSNSIGFLRARASWVYSKYANVSFKSIEFKTSALEAVCKLLIDEELPVRYEAALALPKILSWEVSKARLSTELKNVLEIYLKLINEIDSEDVVEALESVISIFPKEILPFSLELTQHLVTAFGRLIEKDVNEDEGESAMAAVSTLNTIGKIIDFLEERPEDLLKVSFILKPTLEYCLSVKGCDYFEEALNLLTSLLYYSPENSLPHLYYLVRYLKASILGEGTNEPYATEHIDEVFSPLANLIKKYKQQTLENINGILEIGFLLIKDNEQEAVNGCKVLVALLENFPNALDGYLLQIITQVSETFNKNPLKKVKIACSQTMFVALWNSPLVALSAGPLLTPAFQYALSNITVFSESMARIHIIYGLGSLFFIIPSLPSALQNTLPGIFHSIIQLCEDNEDNSSIEADEFEEENKFPVNLDSQCQKIIEKIRQSNFDEDDEDNEYPFGINEEDLYDSPFEVMNQNDLIKRIVELVKGISPEFYQNVVSLLNESEIKLLHSLIR